MAGRELPDFNDVPSEFLDGENAKIAFNYCEFKYKEDEVNLKIKKELTIDPLDEEGFFNYVINEMAYYKKQIKDPKKFAENMIKAVTNRFKKLYADYLPDMLKPEDLNLYVDK